MKKSIIFRFIASALLLGVYSVKAQISFDLRISNELQNAGIITTVVQDHQGYIWIGSTGGLLRYDGSKVISITNNPQDINSLASNWVENIVIDSNDIIWLGTRAGLDRYDRSNNTFTHYKHNIKDNGSLSNDTITAMIQDRSGNIWVGTRKGLNMFNAETGKFTHYYNKVNDPASLSHNDVNVLYEDSQGVLWAGCGSPFYEHGGTPEDGGLNRFDKQKGEFKRYIHDAGNPNSIENNKVRAILEDSKGNFWVGTAGDGLQTLDRATGIFTHFHYDSTHPERLSRPPVQKHPWGIDHITFLHEDVNGLIWIGTLAAGINQYNPVTKKVTHYGFIATSDKIIKADTLSGFKNSQQWHAFTSKDGLLWISALREVYTVNTNPKFIIPYFKTKQRNVNAFYEEKNGSLWIGTDTGLIYKDITGKEQIFLKTPADKNSLNNNVVTSIQPDSEGKLWLATWGGGINKFDPLTQTFTHYVHDAKRNSLSSNNVNNLLFDNNGILWAATDSGLNRLNVKSGFFTVYRHNANDSNSLGDDGIFCMLEDQNFFWLGTDLGVERLSKKSGKFSHYLLKNDIRSLFVDKDGVLWTGAWLGPSDGLYSYDKINDRFIPYTAADGNIKINRVENIIGDNQDNLWISTYNAIYKIDHNRNAVTFYDDEYGVHIDSFGLANNYKTRNGKLFLGDQGGYYAFSPEQITASIPPQIYITSFQLGDKEVVPGKGSALSEPLYRVNKITFKYNQSSFSIAFWATHFTSPGEEMYWYKLENYDTVWHDGANRKAYFFNLSPGDYIFHVKAMNSDGVWSEKKFSVIISPPWWQTWWAITLVAFGVIAIAWTFYYFRSRKLRKENQLLEEKVNHRTAQLQQSIEELKSTQAQLIQSEKMASLGELTAGIAHEIQNPLNFVNNFSDVNSELIGELVDEVDKGNTEQAKAIAEDIKQNLEKINHHGKRADAIVKGMLQHSKASTGHKEPTDINKLADEYLRLAYHGLRAKDKSFNTDFKTEFDESIGKINIVPQDIGRVLLNLFNNAFYAVHEKKSQLNGTFVPTVTVCTRKLSDKIEIVVKDNGNGIPQNIVDKIFQPFFTTKPTGQGTGLGLSLSYDIVKAHGGEIKVESREGEGTAFIIRLQINRA